MTENLDRSDSCRLRAEGMAQIAGISLSEDQISAYKRKQGLIYKNAKGYLKNHPSIPSDQEILDSLLDPEQAATFRGAYPNIFSPKKQS
jgi:hypothetical protein